MSEKSLNDRITEVKAHIIGLKDSLERFYEAKTVITNVVRNANAIEGIDYLEDVSSTDALEVLGNLYALLGKLEMERGEK